MRGLDQAAGLRRILQRRAVRVLPMLGAEHDHWVAVLLAEALARRGERVLLIDQGEGAAARALGARPKHTLGDMIVGRCELDEALCVGTQGVHVGLAGDAFDQLRALDISAELFFSAFAHAPAPVDLVLVRVCQPAVIARCLADEGEILLSTSSQAAALFAAYSSVKRSCARSHRYRTLVHGVDSAEQAQAVYERVARTAERFLGIAPLYAGHIPLGAHEPGPSHRASVTRAAERLAAQLVTWPLAEFAAHEHAPGTLPMAH